MGYSITWFAVREDKAEQLLKELALSPTGEVEDLPDSLISTARLDTGWRMFWYNDYDCPFLQPQDRAALSKDKEILLCLVEEHCMASSAELWSQGERKWRVSHEGEDGPKGLDTDGDLPESFPAIRNEMEQAQRADGGDEAEVDHLFEIPLKLAQTLVGFKHDEDDTHVIDRQYIVLSRPSATTGTSGTGTGLLSRLFGK